MFNLRLCQPAGQVEYLVVQMCYSMLKPSVLWKKKEEWKELYSKGRLTLGLQYEVEEKW